LPKTVPWLNVLVSATQVLLIALLAISSGGKLLPGRARVAATASAESVRLRLPLGVSAATLVRVAAVVELVALVALIITPTFGFAWSGLLFLLFVPIGRLIPEGQPCGCFGESSLALNESHDARAGRNIGLLALAAFGWIMYPRIQPTGWDSTLGGIVALTALWCAYASAALLRSSTDLRSHPFAGTARAERSSEG
jgi:hypothetical protein